MNPIQSQIQHLNDKANTSLHFNNLRWHARLQVLYLEIDEITGDCTLESR